MGPAVLVALSPLARVEVGLLGLGALLAAAGAAGLWLTRRGR